MGSGVVERHGRFRAGDQSPVTRRSRHQPRMTRRLPQSQQGFQHLDLGLREAVGFDLRQQGPAIVGDAVQFEPIHAGRDFEAESSRAAEQLAIGFHVPASFDQRPGDARELRGRQFPVRLRVHVVPGSKADTDVVKESPGGFFRGGIAAHKAALLGVVQSAGFMLS